MGRNNKEVYKHYATQGDQPEFLAAPVSKEELEREVEEAKKAVNDPFLLSSLMLRTIHEREATNMLLKTLIEKMDRVEQKLGREKEFPASVEQPLLLSKQDEDIVDVIIEKGAACAHDIQQKLNYKGKNAACARLTKLADMGVLVKKQVGRSVYYQLSENGKSHANSGGSGPME